MEANGLRDLGTEVSGKPSAPDLFVRLALVADDHTDVVKEGGDHQVVRSVLALRVIGGLKGVVFERDPLIDLDVSPLRLEETHDLVDDAHGRSSGRDAIEEASNGCDPRPRWDLVRIVLGSRGHAGRG